MQEPVAARVRVADDLIAAPGEAAPQNTNLVLELVGELESDPELEARVDDPPSGGLEELEQAIGEAAVAARVVAPAGAGAGVADEVMPMTELAAAEAAGGTSRAAWPDTPGR